MKKVLCLSIVVVLLAGFASFALADEGSWTGWIADANCAKNYEKAAKAEHAACAKSCVSKGAGWALAMQDGMVLLDVSNEMAEQHLGHEVIVKGDLNKDTNTVKVTSIEKAKKTE
jgi:hypothetical protein